MKPIDRGYDLWRQLQAEALRAVKSYVAPEGYKLYVYILLRASIDIVVQPTGMYLHLKRETATDPSNGEIGSAIVVRSSRMSSDLVVCADPDRGFILDSGEALSVDKFSVWLLDLALRLSGPVSL